MHASQVEMAAAPQRRWRRFLPLVILLVLGGWFARFAYLRITLEPTPRPEYWAEKIAALDPPPADCLTAKEILERLADRPFEAGFTAATSSQPGMYAGDQMAMLAGFWDESRADIAASGRIFESSEFMELRRRLIDAADRGWVIPFEPTLNTAVPYASQFRAWSKWLVAHSRWSIEHARDIRAAVDDWRTVLRMSRSMERGGVLINHLVGVACVALVAQEMILESRAASTQTGAAALLIESLGAARTADELFAGERYYTHSLLEYRYVRIGGDWLAVNHASTSFGTRVLPSPAWNLTSPLFYDLATARGMIDDLFGSLSGCDDIVSAWRLYKDKSRVNSLGALVGDHGWNTELLARAALLDFRSRVAAEAAVAMLAIEEFRHQQGRYPDRLDELVPAFLPRLPIDYADRKALRYRVIGDRYTLYSVAEDGKDDGGVIQRDGDRYQRRPSWEHDSDYIFTDMTRRPLDNQ